MPLTPLTDSTDSPPAAEPLTGGPLTNVVTAQGEYAVSVVTNLEQLGALEADWTDLAAQAVEQNVFYEPWMLMPAIDHLGEQEQWHFVIVVKNHPAEPPRLCGFFPFIETRGPGRIRQLTLWKHDFCFLTTPLIRTGHLAGVLQAVVRYCEQSCGDRPLIELPLIPGEGPFQQAIVDLFRSTLTTTFQRDQFLRAIVQIPDDAENYLKTSIGGHHFRELNRNRRKLEQRGTLEYRFMHDPRTVCHWTEWFLDLEARGWKAQAGTAMQLIPAHSVFFRQATFTGAQQGKVRFEGLFLNGEPIALKCNLVSAPACFAFKIAFDETLKKHSPGVLLELESLRTLSRTPEIRWCDSCAVPGHQMINRLWTERRVIQHLHFATGRGTGPLLLGTLPLLRAVNRLRKQWFGKREPGESTPPSSL
ncbi:GNAT family N-acetyltransferase [Planctomicrobium sp. SH664]|uniref:GNAT family N-acetyltransferase n=1 Tax=Planctomicrobium sp. SH664 TaxID=3448125 RepID=UPI003F5B082E